METVFVLRVCSPYLTSHKGFQWPSTIGAKVSAPDWSDNAECGNGLHGWLHGAGDTSVAEHTNNPDAKWLCLEVDADTIVNLNGKAKFPTAIVRFVGNRRDAAQWIVDHDHLADPSIVIGHCATAGQYGTATAGDGGTATAGQYGTATAGYGGEIRIRYIDCGRYRTALGYVGEAGILPNVPYRCNKQGELIKCAP